MSTALECFGTITVDDIATTVISGVALIVVTFVGMITYDKFNERKMNHRGLRLLFYAACISSCLALIGGIGQNVLCMMMGIEMEYLCVILSFIGYVSLLQCVLGVFVLRLYATFERSAFALSKMKRRILGITYLVMVFMWMLQIALLFYIVFGQNRYVEDGFVIPLSLWSLIASTWVIFIALSIYSVYKFVDNMLLTAKMRSNHSSWSPGLDKKQRQMINLSAKYLSLFLFAEGTTFAHFGFFSFCTYNDLDPSILLGIDCIANVLCLFLQWGFAAIYYYRYCRKLDGCCRRLMTWRMGKQDQAIKAKRAVLAVPRLITVDEQNIASNLEGARPGVPGVTRHESDPDKIASADHGRDRVTVGANNPSDDATSGPKETSIANHETTRDSVSFKIINETALARHILNRISSGSARVPEGAPSTTIHQIVDDSIPIQVVSEDQEKESEVGEPGAVTIIISKITDENEDENKNDDLSHTPIPGAYALGRKSDTNTTNTTVSSEATGSVSNIRLDRLEVVRPLQDEDEVSSTWNLSNIETPGLHLPVPGTRSPTSTAHSDDWQSTQL